MIVNSCDIPERKRAELRLTAFSDLGQKLSAAKVAWEATEIIVDVADQLLGWDACTFDLCSLGLDQAYHVLNRATINGQRVESASVRNEDPPSPRARRAISPVRPVRSWRPCAAASMGAKRRGD